MPVVALTVAVAASSLLLWSALEKARAFSTFTQTLQQLGVPSSLARQGAVAVIVTEGAVSIALLGWPGRPATLAMLAALSCVFAAAGLLALRQEKTIVCGCFGVHGRQQLGWPQLVALPVWIAAVAILWVNGDTHAFGVQPSSLAAVVALGLVTLRIPPSIRAAFEARGDRRSAREMYAWLNR